MKRYRPKVPPGRGPREMRERANARDDERGDPRGSRRDAEALEDELTIEILDADGGSTEQRIPLRGRPDRAS